MKLFSFFRHQSSEWKEVKKNWLIQSTGRISLVLIGASVISIVVLWNKLPPFVPLWFSRPWGIDQLAHPAWLFMLPAGSMIVYLINRWVVIFFAAEYLIFAQMAYLTSLLVSLLSFISLVKIISIII